MIADVMSLSQGGIKAVVWTDAVQMLILFVGLISLVVLGSVRVGGADAVWRIAVDTGRINYDEYAPPGKPVCKMTPQPLAQFFF